MEQTKKYNADWSPAVWLVTLFVFGLFIFFLFRTAAMTIYPALGLGIIIAGCFLFAPIGYILSGSAVIINRPMGRLQIDFASIEQARRIDKKELGFVLRTGGVGGLFGFFGHFHSSKLNTFKGYTTNSKNMVLLTNKNGEKTILSPSCPDDFIQSILRSKNENN